MTELQQTCTVCGACECEVGPRAGAFSVCPLWDDEAAELVGDRWHLNNCLDEQLVEEEARALNAESAT